jgi:cytochrome P450
MRGGALDERHFAEPARFDPGRWLVRGDGGEVIDAGSAKRVAMPFGAGPRICPGRYLALHEMKMVIAMLLAGFEIEGLDVAGGGEPRERLALTMSPVGLAMRLRPRAE